MKNKSICSTILSVLLLVSPLAGASEEKPEAEKPAPPAYCENHDGFNQFDFWVGEWKVYSNDEKRTYLGDNSVTKHHANCLIIENWTSAGGGGGMSMNYFNPITDEWRQVWVSNGYAIDYTGGLSDRGEMVLSGEIYSYQKGLRQKFKGIWTALENGDVIQHFDVKAKDDGEWQTWFEGRYIRQ